MSIDDFKKTLAALKNQAAQVLSSFINKTEKPISKLAEKTSGANPSLSPSEPIAIDVRTSTQWIKKIFIISRKYYSHQELFHPALKSMLKAQSFFHIHLNEPTQLAEQKSAMMDTRMHLDEYKAAFIRLQQNAETASDAKKDASIVVDLMGRQLRWLEGIS